MKTQNQMNPMIHCMKTPRHLIAVLIALALTPAFAQPQPAPPARPLPGVAQPPTAPEPPPGLTKFNLDFPGGMPRQLVTAIEKATGNSLNVIIPEAAATSKLPPFKLKNVDVAQLFEALRGSSDATFISSGGKTQDSVWVFVGRRSPPKAIGFYSLAPYLERSLTVDDITTAIQTGWEMLGDKDTPAINYHKDTKLLIVVGEKSKLETIDAVLKALQPVPSGSETFAERLQNIIQKASPAPATPAPAPKSSDKPKTEN
jgi:hypothetical protein